VACDESSLLKLDRQGGDLTFLVSQLHCIHKQASLSELRRLRQGVGVVGIVAQDMLSVIAVRECLAILASTLHNLLEVSRSSVARSAFRKLREGIWRLQSLIELILL